MFLCSLQLPVQKRKKQGNRKRHFKTHNNHLAGVLEDYSEGVPVKKWDRFPRCFMPSEEWCRICKWNWLEMETLVTLQYKDFFMAVCCVKTSLFSFSSHYSRWSVVLYYMEWIATVLWNPFYFVYWSVITGGHWGKREPRPFMDNERPYQKHHPTTVLLKCKWGWSGLNTFFSLFYLVYIAKRCVWGSFYFKRAAAFHPFNRNSRRQACVMLCSASHWGLSSSMKHLGRYFSWNYKVFKFSSLCSTMQHSCQKY